VKIMALKFLGADARGSSLDAIRCLDYAVAKGARVISNSWGGGGYSQALRDAIARVRAAGALFVASAGNDGANTDTTVPHYPSSYDLDNVVSVAASTSLDGLASFSNYGPMSVDIAAPGSAILSTVRGNTYASKSGTSMAAPFVSGAASLVMAAFPGISHQQVAARLLGSADRLPGFDGKVASGRLNVARAIEADVRPPGQATLTAVPTLATRTSVTVAWTAPDEDGPLGANGASAYELRYRIAGTAGWIDASAPRPAPPGTAQTATIRGLRPGRVYDVSLSARDNVGNAAAPVTVKASTTPGVELRFDDLEGASSWTSTLPWALATDRAHSPLRAWTDSAGRPYASNTDASVTMPPVRLTGLRNPTLSFWQRYNLEQNRDIGAVEISVNGGASWTRMTTFSGGADWAPAEVDLRPYAGAADARIRFRIVTDAAKVHDGWLIDDVVVSADA
jgi:hypothetical protein